MGDRNMNLKNCNRRLHENPADRICCRLTSAFCSHFFASQFFCLTVTLTLLPLSPLPVAAAAEATPIPLTELGARATADYQGDALGITAAADGAQLRTAFQKLSAAATPEGLWLTSTET